MNPVTVLHHYCIPSNDKPKLSQQPDTFLNRLGQLPSEYYTTVNKKLVLSLRNTMGATE